MNLNKTTKEISWDFLAKAILACFLILQFSRWVMLLQSMDIYYHLLTAWGFIQAGGYSGWDFWQYAPVGRIHIYPPLLHIVFAGLIQLGINQIILAKLCEALLPWIFLCVLWNFIKTHYSRSLGLFVVLAFFSSFSFYQSLLNHLPATLAFVFGTLCLDQFFKNRLLRSAILLGLCFYTHIGLPWFFLLALIFYGLLDKEQRKGAFIVCLLAFILALPMLIQEYRGLKSMTTLGLDLHEKYLSQIKIFDFLFLSAGLVIAFNKKGKHLLFLSFFFAGFIFLIYPYRFFSAEGYFPTILLSALLFDALYQRVNKNYLLFAIAVFTLVFSPTLSLHKQINDKKMAYKLNFYDSGFINLLLAKGNILWFPKEYFSTAGIVKANSADNDIIFSSINYIGLAISSLSGRASANALLPEIKLTQGYKPLASSKIIILSCIDNPLISSKIINTFGLIKVGENNFFSIYKNPNCRVQAKIVRAVLPFWVIFGVILLALGVFWQAKKIGDTLYKFSGDIS